LIIAVRYVTNRNNLTGKEGATKMAEIKKDGEGMELLTSDLSANNVVEQMARGEMESQIDQALRYPRSLEKFKQRATAMACLDEETAASCLYRRPVGKDEGKMKYAEGMSIRMAEIVGACYGNLRVYATLISQTERQVIARGMAIDLEANFASSSEVVESTVGANGRPYSERMRTVTAKAALAKARRDATFQVVPRALATPVESEVRKLLHGDSKSLETRRAAVGGWIKTLGIEPARVYNALGVVGLADLGLNEMETLTGLRTALKDNETSIDEAFPPIVDEKKETSDKPTLDSLAAKLGGTKEEPKVGDVKADVLKGAVDAQGEKPEPGLFEKK
jgi:hypothetical protein